MKVAHINQKKDFTKTHKKLRTAGFIFRLFKKIISGIRTRTSTMDTPSFTSDLFGTTLEQAWIAQKEIGWIQLLKGRLSSHWAQAQGVFNAENPDTRNRRHFNANTWMVKTIGSLIDLSLGLWNDRCCILHGVDKKMQRQKSKEQLKTQILKCFDNRDMIAKEHRDIFDEDPAELCSRESLQYLQSWINTYYTVLNYSKRQQRQTRQMLERD